MTGAVFSGLFAFGAHRTRTLSASGAFSAAIVGTISIAAGWTWGLLLFSYFVSSSALSKLGEGKKAERVGPIVEKGDERDAVQVLANGGVFAGAALCYIMAPSSIWYALAAGALAASAADTWATELGTLFGADALSIVSGKRVPAGTSGAITLVGSVAGFGGALFVAAVAAFAHWPVAFAAVALGGVAGATADSILGGTIQARRWCDLCAKGTERLVHDCGTTTRLAGGVAGLDNDSINTICSAVGALVALLLS